MTADALLQKLVEGFLGEAQDLAQSITRSVLGMERGSAGAPALAAAYDEVARHLHTLKGSAGTLALDDLATLAHRVETRWVRSQDTQGPPADALVDTLLEALDLFLQRLEARAAGSNALEAEVVALLERLGDAPADRMVQPACAEERSAPVPAEPPAGSAADPGWRVQTRQITELTRAVERLREVCLRLETRRRELDRTHRELEALKLVGAAAPVGARLRTTARALEVDSQETLDVVARLEEGLRAILTLPVQTVLEPLKRTVRDLGRQLGKEVVLSAVGGEVALDRRVLERLRGPLVHLVRNAVDHGIEPPAQRQAAGKHTEGIITLRLEPVGNLLFLEVADDGGGLDTERIRTRAVQRGLVGADAATALERAQVHAFIFQPGFSTASQVTETSGRGVGLDVVRAEVEALEGRVEVQSTPGQGTRVVLTLPLELGGSPILVVHAGEQSFGLPMLAVEATVAAHPSVLLVGQGRPQLRYRDGLLEVADLGVLLGQRQAVLPRQGQPLLVLQSGGRKVALAVDEAAGDMELIIRPLPSELRALQAYQGSATLPRGEPLLVLRPDWLVAQAQGAPGPAAPSTEPRALVVDDSLTARALHRSVLEAGGYKVHTVSSAAQALRQLAVANYDVVITDIGMADMDGLAFTAALRSTHRTQALPVIMVSAHDNPQERARGLAAGANAFLGKKECVSGRLLEEVGAVLGRVGGGP